MNRVPGEPRRDLAKVITYRPQSNNSGKRFQHSSSSKPRLLDLFCCAGGAGVGYCQAGFDVVGVDIRPRTNYPLPFIRADVLTLDPEFIASLRRSKT
jgi:hypothetical protein